eukprot:scaffold133953_cov48-Prasinocladus_malaysianus.AAC.1
MGFKVFVEPGLEADDVVGALATSSARQGMLVTIASSDKDFQQLLGPLIRIAKPAKKTIGVQNGQVAIYTESDFREEFQDAVTPLQFKDVLALAGDSSDNVPGVSAAAMPVKGVGIKTAIQLISLYGTLENVISHASELTWLAVLQIKRKNVRETLQTEEGIASARLSKQLVDIQTDLAAPSLATSMSDLEIPSAQQMLQGAYEPWLQLELKSLITQLKDKVSLFRAG